MVFVITKDANVQNVCLPNIEYKEEPEQIGIRDEKKCAWIPISTHESIMY
jgi:hypothetical protein